MIHCILFLLWFFDFVRLSLALDRAEVKGQFLVNNRTGGMMILNGINYSTSNATTVESDSLVDAEACRRDAALMQKLGINLISTNFQLNLDSNHDDCFSIFNSAQIYILLNVEFSDNPLDNPGSSYTGDRLGEIFRLVDLVKNYENLLGLSFAAYPDPIIFTPVGTDPAQFVTAAKTLRAFIRDVKEYITKNSAKKILVGARLYHLVDYLWPDSLRWMSCNVPNEPASSTIDFVQYASTGWLFENATSMKKGIGDLSDFLERIGYHAPTIFDTYRTYKETNGTMTIDNETVSQDINQFFGVDGRFNIIPLGLFTGVARSQWSNTNLYPGTPLPYLVTLDKSGNVRLTWEFDSTQNATKDLNTQRYFDMGPPSDVIKARLNCAPDLIKNTTATVISKATYIRPTDWALPTRPPQVHDLITKGASGRQGQMVDVTKNMINQEILDSSGRTTHIVLEPTSSRARVTTGAPKPTAGSATSSLTTASKAGIGVGSAVGALIIISTIYLVYRRRNYKKPDSASGEDNKDGGNEEGLFTKPELPSDNVHEKSAGSPLEAAGGGNIAELPQIPLQQPPQELSGTQHGNDVVEGSDPVFELPGKGARSPQELAGDEVVELNADVEGGLRQ